MSIFDAGKKLIPIDIFFIEQEQDNGMSKFHFIHSQEEFDTWKNKGYYTQEDASALRRRTPGQAQTPGPDPKKAIQIIRTEWQRLTWRDQNLIFSKALRQIPSGDRVNAELDPIIYRDLKLKLCLKRWNITDSEGREIPVTEANIDSLIPEFATELINSFEKKTESDSSE